MLIIRSLFLLRRSGRSGLDRLARNGQSEHRSGLRSEAGSRADLPGQSIDQPQAHRGALHMPLGGESDAVVADLQQEPRAAVADRDADLAGAIVRKGMLDGV